MVFILRHTSHKNIRALRKDSARITVPCAEIYFNLRKKASNTVSRSCMFVDRLIKRVCQKKEGWAEDWVKWTCWAACKWREAPWHLPWSGHFLMATEDIEGRREGLGWVVVNCQPQNLHFYLQVIFSSEFQTNRGLTLFVMRLISLFLKIISSF